MDIPSCILCPFGERCPCGYSAGNAACLTIRERYAGAMTERSNALYDKAQGETEVVVSGNCVVCGKQLNCGRLFVCKKCKSNNTR